MMAVKQNYDFLRIVTLSFWISLETKSLLTWEDGSVRLTGVLYLPALRLLRLYMYHEKIIYSSFTLKEYPSISQPLSVIFLSYFTVCSPFPLSFRVQSFHLSKIESIKLWAMDCRKICFKVNSFEVIVLLILFWPKTVNLLLQKKKYDIHTAHRRLFHLHPTPPRILLSRGSLMTPLPRGISRIVKREFLPAAEIQSGFWKWTQLRKYSRILLQQCKH